MTDYRSTQHLNAAPKQRAYEQQTDVVTARPVRPGSLRMQSPRFGVYAPAVRGKHAGLPHVPGSWARTRFARPAQSGSPPSRVSEVLEGVPRPIRH